MPSRPASGWLLTLWCCSVGIKRTTTWHTRTDLAAGVRKPAKHQEVLMAERNEAVEMDRGSRSALIVAPESREADPRKPVSSHGVRVPLLGSAPRPSLLRSGQRTPLSSDLRSTALRVKTKELMPSLLVGLLLRHHLGEDSPTIREMTLPNSPGSKS